ncbi:PIG-L deacetylase family protein [Streptomyces aidingensis]|uniref:N-acetylglucosaminyl deacetylase, LmbE family n=1 Tax=Streptomyces aidingensis TaxID=910347 RepID=A0A1I1V4E3_9ACTN|nr:PIG-L family deacetylase [Streptomyces aidingensis]SFD77907.1 N-acetylglucosaminyl deacetylase, LmbE family [Streptomyces aidingensis]
MTPAELLVIVAHPDDESLHCGGLLHQAASRGGVTVTVTLTRGGAGRTLGMCKEEELPAVREAELRRAAAVLDVACAEVHDLPDGHLADHEAEGAALVLDALRRWTPLRVVAFPPNGMNGHPDHRAAHFLTRLALGRYDGSPQVLLMTSTTPYTEPDRPGFLEPAQVEAMRLPATLRMAVGASLEAKLRAMGHYETQARSVAKVLRCYPEKLLTEAFHQVAG